MSYTVGRLYYTSPRDSSPNPGVFRALFYNHARRLRLEKTVIFRTIWQSQRTAARQFQKRNG
jgi:hypothetical protein